MYRSKNQLGGSAKAIGVIVDWLGDPYQATICAGIEQGAAQAGVNLLFFVGGELAPAGSNAAPNNDVYALAGRSLLDGRIILASTLSHHVGARGVQEFCSRFSDLPLCSVGVPLPNATSVTVDNEAGMAHLVEHVVLQHAARRVAFISGPVANAESETRVRAYRNVLTRHGLPSEDALVVPGDFMMEGGAKAVHALAQRFGANLDGLDAIVAANDNMAIGALDELQRRRVSVPDKVRLLGFDDVEEARLTDPSLTTARQPLHRIGLEALRRVVLSRADNAGERELRISAELVLRRSCGCTAAKLLARDRSNTAAKHRFQLALVGQRERIGALLGRAARGRFSAAGADWEQVLLGAVLEDLLSGVSERFLPAAERMISRLAGAAIDLNAMDDVLTVLREELIPLLLAEPERHRHAEDLFHAVRLSTSAALQRSLGRNHVVLTRWARAIAVVCNSLAAAPSLAELASRLRVHLAWLGVSSYFVCGYVEPGNPDKAWLLASSEQFNPEAPGRPGVFRGRELLPPELTTVEGIGRSFAVLPLVANCRLLGHVLFEYTVQHAFACGVLADAISIALGKLLRPDHGGP